jgi:Domain of unknown function (DUF4258)
MTHTRHMMTRMNHRGIPQDLVDLALEHGEVLQDKYVLGRKTLERLLTEIRDRERTIIRALDKGGVVVVESDNRLITTYTKGSYDRRRARAYVRERKW